MENEAKNQIHRNVPPAGLEVFISHPHRYSQLADVLRETIADWSNGTIKVHQTSEAGASPITVGDSIRPELEECLRRSEVVLLVFVDAESAIYCMYEAGVARARGENPLENTRLVVLQCEGEIPAVFRDDLVVKFTEKSISKFTHDFHFKENFFPSLDTAFAPMADKDLVKRRATILHQELVKARPGSPLPSEELPRWISFNVSLPEAHAAEIEQIANAIEEVSVDTETEGMDEGKTGLDEAMGRARGLISQHCIVEEYPRHMPNHFDMSEFPKGSRTFFSLYNRWKNKMIRSGKSHYIKIDWWGEICDQMTRAIGTYSATEVMRPLKSAADEHTWYLPVMTSMTTAPAEKRYEFSISLIRIPQDSDFLKINVDYSLELTKGEKVPKAEEQVE